MQDNIFVYSNAERKAFDSFPSIILAIPAQY